MLGFEHRKPRTVLNLGIVLSATVLLVLFLASASLAGEDKKDGLFLSVTEVLASKQGGEKFFDKSLGKLIPLLKGARLDYDSFRFGSARERRLRPRLPSVFPLSQNGPMVVKLGSPSPEHPGYVSLEARIKRRMRTHQYIKPSRKLMLHIPSSSGDNGTILMLHLKGTPPLVPTQASEE